MSEVLQMELRCSFCGAPRDYTEYLVGSPYGVYICDECAKEAVRLMEERRRQKEAE